jgi:hypothetical protein
MVYELAERSGDGISVRLCWDEERNQVTLRYRDWRNGDAFVTDVPNDDALAAFRHPNAFRPLRRAA